MTSKRRRVLCVDDDRNLLAGLRRTLGAVFEVSVAESGMEGLRLIEQEEPFDVVVSDMRMPEMNGSEFLKLAREFSPRTARILLTGHADVESAIAAVNEGQVSRFLTKPCPPHTLLTAVKTAMTEYAAVHSAAGVPETVDPGPAKIEAGAQVSRYRLLEKIGQGGMGVVFKAEDEALDRLVAMKFLLARYVQDEEAYDRFNREARTASSINHPSVCTIYDCGRFGGRPYLVMELLSGMPLSGVISQGPMEVPRALDLAVMICEGLRAAHARGVVHRDVKPANIVLTDDGAVKILDFGLAKLAEVAGLEYGARTEPITNPGVVMGTPEYASPEQLRGDPADQRSDLFAAGLVLYEMLAGQRAFGGPHTAIISVGIMSHNPPPLPGINPLVSAELDAVVSRSLEKDPARRFQTAEDLRAALIGVRDGLGAESERRNRYTPRLRAS